MQTSQVFSKTKVRIVVFASGWDKTQEYDNNLVKSFVKDGYSVDMVSYDQNTKTINPQMLYATAYNYTVGGNPYVKRKAKNLLNADEMQKVKKELNDDAHKYQHTVYINGFGRDDYGQFDELYKDILTKGQDRTCLNWCTCCQAPQKYSQEPVMTCCNVVPSYICCGKPPYLRCNTDDMRYEEAKIVDGESKLVPYDGEVQSELKQDVESYIANKKLNADFSQSLVDEICVKVKEQEQQNASQLNMNNDSFGGNQAKSHIGEEVQENKGWFHKTFGVPFVDCISYNKSNNDILKKF